jgi:hypothetical protein
MNSLKTTSGRDNVAVLSNINLYIIVNGYPIRTTMNTDVIVDIRALPIIMSMT